MTDFAYNRKRKARLLIRNNRAIFNHPSNLFFKIVIYFVKLYNYQVIKSGDFRLQKKVNLTSLLAK